MKSNDDSQPIRECTQRDVGVSAAVADTDEQREEISGIILARRHSGPLPPREILEGYDAISPGSAKRMIDNVVRRSELRTEEEHKSARTRRLMGPVYRIFAFTVVCVVIYFGYRLAEQGATVVGFALVVTAAGTIAGTFLLNALETRKESRSIERLITLIQRQQSAEQNDEP